MLLLECISIIDWFLRCSFRCSFRCL